MRQNPLVRSAVVVAALVGLAGSATAQQPPASSWYGRMAKPKNFELPRKFGDVFTIELPKDWQFVAGHTGTLFQIAEKTKRADPGGAIILEYMRLQAVFDPALLSALAPIELEDVQRRETAGKSFNVESRMVDGRALILIQYDRPGLFGAPDHVVQYSFPVGQTMYRLICIAPAADIEKYKPIFAHAAASFTPTPPKGAGH